MLWWLATLATVALVLAAAKAHGRQIRLEREQQGFFEVDFRKANPPPVEAIWRTDRRIFWPVFAVLALLAGYWAFNAIVAADLGFAALLLAWGFAAAFTVAGLASWWRSARREGGEPTWHRAAFRGSLGWWSLVAMAAALVAVSSGV